MILIEFKVGGNELAKVLHYYGLLEGDDEFKIICPFHEDINPSMLVKLSEGSFYCFGCGVNGDALKFVMLANKGEDDLENVKKYFKILKSKKVRKIKISDRNKTYKPENEQAMAEAEDYYFGLKTIDWRREECLEKDYMKKRGFFPSSLNKCKAKLTYNNHYPIIFPMFDLGKFKGWVCRTTSPGIEKKRKYLYNKGFSRSNTLVGDYSSKVVVLVEGYMDWLKMRQYGATKVAAILGWKVTPNQIEKLKSQGVEHIISALDNDTCGDKGTKYLKKFFKVTRFQFPEGVKDPGEMNKRQFDIANQKTKILYRGTKNGKSKK